MSPVGLARLPGRSFALSLYEKLHPGLRDERRPKILGRNSRAKFEKQSKHGEIQKF